MNFGSLGPKEAKIPIWLAFLSAVLFIISGIDYSLTGVSTGYVLVIIGLIVGISAARMKKGSAKNAGDSSLTILFFGILNIISFVFILSGGSGGGIAFYSGLIAGLAAVFGGYLGYAASKSKNA
ncbi:hypothetical protein J2128_002390 [Methanomicrobium sp. W14]|uniref:hypothetical protein n=1 Tax=Methanomicrobium sp. W14 TaxID=2817839 RepID=UPI001AE705BA|nr:hypothetical protein [Methanomicrobium sp. W14]MBP2134424.1 hypothetical protein [Methanomicrobium sp. W14]